MCGGSSAGGALNVGVIAQAVNAAVTAAVAAAAVPATACEEGEEKEDTRSSEVLSLLAPDVSAVVTAVGAVPPARPGGVDV